MGNRSITFVLLSIVLCNFHVSVSARPLSSTEAVDNGGAPFGTVTTSQHFVETDNQPIIRDTAPFDSEEFINIPVFTDNENEPIRRDEIPYDPEAFINTPILSGGDQPIKRETRNIKDAEPAARGNKPSLKGKRQGANPVDIFSSLTPEAQDGSDDLFTGEDSGGSKIQVFDGVLQLLTCHVSHRTDRVLAEWLWQLI